MPIMTKTSLTASEAAIAQQEPSSLGSSSRRQPATQERTPLYSYYWPPVPAFSGFEHEFAEFLAASPAEQEQRLAALRERPEAHGKFLHESLGEIYAHWFGYRDGPYTRHTDDDAELALYQAKLRLERELFEHWITPKPAPDFDDQFQAADYLDTVAATNPGVGHPLFEYLATEATREQLARFLQAELIRNEVVDDEVALLVVGLQGMQKAVAAANLWDECGRGKLENFHTYWLRRLLEATDGWQDLYDYRSQHPWFAKFTSNMNAAMLTRSSRKMMAYGCFLVFESWVEPHFVKILEGLTRVGVLDDEVRLYFTAHVKIDPRHSQELSDGLREQRPLLDQHQVAEVVRGAMLAAEAGRRQFDHMLGYLQSLPVAATVGASA
jgi:hypothetical protein